MDTLKWVSLRCTKEKSITFAGFQVFEKYAPSHLCSQFDFVHTIPEAMIQIHWLFQI